MPSKNGRSRSTKAYLKNRAALLRDKPRCHWCKKRQATTADHLIEHDRGGSDELDNLVPACLECNGRRGANYKASKARARQVARADATNTPRPRRAQTKRKTKKASEFFEITKQTPPRPSLSLSKRKSPERKGKGHDRPRIETIIADAAGSHGPEVAQWAKRVLGVELMPWQVHVLNGQLSVDADGRWCNPLSLVSVARQNGKTVALKALLGWWLTDYSRHAGPQ
ncbi:MAG: hypothetical protein EBT80_09315, partial [Chitinophagales bacterium]|nr:hypothetical protein [Chitinophagales bacterium]